MRGSKIRKLSAALALLPAVLVAQQVSVPDTIYINGSVITMDGARIVQAVAVRGDRIAATGTSEAIRKMAGPATTIVDLKGATMLPGLIDPHSLFPDLPSARSTASTLS
jgi:imidazolonepropionase-like amidohydrolase